MVKDIKIKHIFFRSGRQITEQHVKEIKKDGTIVTERRGTEYANYNHYFDATDVEMMDI